MPLSWYLGAFNKTASLSPSGAGEVFCSQASRTSIYRGGLRSGRIAGAVMWRTEGVGSDLSELGIQCLKQPNSYSSGSDSSTQPECRYVGAHNDSELVPPGLVP